MFLVTFVVGAGGAVRDYAVRAISRLAGADLTISAESGTTLPPEIADRAAGADGVAGVTPVYGLVGTTPTGLEVGAVDPARAADVLGLTTTEGDLGSLDEEGYLSIVGRARDVLRTGGETVAPLEVEDALRDHPAIAEVAVVGIPDVEWGEVVCAVVVVVPGREAEVDVDALRAHCRDRLAGYKHPRRVELVDALPRTPATGQIQRALIVERITSTGR